MRGFRSGPRPRNILSRISPGCVAPFWVFSARRGATSCSCSDFTHLPGPRALVEDKMSNVLCLVQTPARLSSSSPPTYRCDSKRSTQYIIADNLLNRAPAKRIMLWRYQPWDTTKWACLRVSRSLWKKKKHARGNASLDVFEVQNASEQQKIVTSILYK